MFLILVNAAVVMCSSSYQTLAVFQMWLYSYFKHKQNCESSNSSPWWVSVFPANRNRKRLTRIIV